MSKMKYVFPFYGKLLHDSDCSFSIKTQTEDEYILNSSSKINSSIGFLGNHCCMSTRRMFLSK